MAKISVNKLAELLVSANPARRRRILQDQKYPNAPIVARYRLAQDPINQFLTNGRDEAKLKDAIAKLRDDRSGTEWAIDDRWNTADALEKLLEMSDLIPSKDGEEYQQGEQNAPKLAIAGVDISIRPDFLISFEKRGKKYTGALKFHFIKNPDSALTKSGSEYVSTLLRQWLEIYGPDGTTPSHTHCLCVDVFRSATVSAPRSTTKRMIEITAACEEIAARWPQL
ncbi:hypothetical protein C380_08670 [Acidovorax sp. KKS102]|uniref:hypothetical protein n=1 Tax=Acidovorax sp. KKS102 TaxID=358220 RepID=UPI00028BBDC3|nr:hypothetical protein [Acidovorax sp. KKS102]AFU45436.1 hypothetical protein C380_08670 [Acidovorax sp. KKS102]